MAIFTRGSSIQIGDGYETSGSAIVRNLKVSGIAGITFKSGLSGTRRYPKVKRVSDTAVTVSLDFNGNIDTAATLTFTLNSGAIAAYNGSALTAELPVFAVAETQPPIVVAETPVNTQQPTLPSIPQPTVEPTPQPNVGTTPQPTVVHIPDTNLRVAIQQVIGNQITTNTLLNLTTLEGYNLEISDLTGLEHATNLSVLSLWGNSISDVAPLAGLTQLTELDLYDNNISDVSPLVGLTRLTDLSLEENPLNDIALNTHIPAIQANGTEVEFDDRTPTTPPPPSQNPINTRTPTVPIDPSQPAIYLGGADGIQRANLDGSNVQTLVAGVYPSKLTLDAAGGRCIG